MVYFYKKMSFLKKKRVFARTKKIPRTKIFFAKIFFLQKCLFFFKNRYFSKKTDFMTKKRYLGGRYKKLCMHLLTKCVFTLCQLCIFLGFVAALLSQMFLFCPRRFAPRAKKKHLASSRSSSAQKNT